MHEESTALRALDTICGAGLAKLCIGLPHFHFGVMEEETREVTSGPEV